MAFMLNYKGALEYELIFITPLKGLDVEFQITIHRE
jgi:hypothetical protein